LYYDGTVKDTTILHAIAEAPYTLDKPVKKYQQEHEMPSGYEKGRLLLYGQDGRVNGIITPENINEMLLETKYRKTKGTIQEPVMVYLTPEEVDVITRGRKFESSPRKEIVHLTADDVQKILNLKHAWEFILDKDVIQAESNYYLLCHIAKLVNEGFFYDGGRIRGVPVTIGGTKYVPPIPQEFEVKECINKIINSNKEKIDIAIELCMYCMRTQIFIDGNKRASVIFANHYMIAHGLGLIVIPEAQVPEFKKKLVKYYEKSDIKEINKFLKDKCWRKIEMES
jgi:prophage maintenance system killer protein